MFLPDHFELFRDMVKLVIENYGCGTVFGKKQAIGVLGEILSLDIADDDSNVRRPV